MSAIPTTSIYRVRVGSSHFGHLPLWSRSASSRSSSRAAVSSLPCQTFSGLIFFFFPFCSLLLFAHLTECEKFVLGNVCLPARGPQGSPHHGNGRRRPGELRVAISKWPLLEGGHAACAWLSALWQCGPCTYWHGPVMFSEARGLWQCGSTRCRKMLGSNESQQCLWKLATNPKTLCNWDIVNISKLPYNKLSVFIYFHIISAFFFFLRQSAI